MLVYLYQIHVIITIVCHVSDFDDPSIKNKREIQPQPNMQKYRLSV